MASTPATLPFTLAQPTPNLRVLVSFDRADDATPEWVDYSTRVRAASTGHGRGDERSSFDPGTAEVTFDDRDRVLDPLAHSYVAPTNRLWLLTEWRGVTSSRFYGYIENWQHAYETSGHDATVTAHASDELRVLTLTALPNSSPPRSSYAELAQVDNPAGFWPLNEVPEISIQPAAEVEPNPVDPRITVIRPRPGTGGVGGGGVRIAD